MQNNEYAFEPWGRIASLTSLREKTAGFRLHFRGRGTAGGGFHRMPLR
jgi:hypothetical protein